MKHRTASRACLLRFYPQKARKNLMPAVPSKLDPAAIRWNWFSVCYGGCSILGQDDRSEYSGVEKIAKSSKSCTRQTQNHSYEILKIRQHSYQPLKLSFDSPLWHINQAFELFICLKWFHRGTYHDDCARRGNLCYNSIKKNAIQFESNFAVTNTFAASPG